NVLWQWTAPADTNTAPLLAWASATNAAGDIDSTNNLARMTLFTPELEVTDTRIEPGADNSAAAVAVIRNNGALCATNFLVRFEAGARLLAVKRAPDLLPGNTVELAQTFTSVLDFASATGSVTITVDPDNTVAESNETNNQGECFAFINTDTNTNGIPDGWEQLYFGGPVNAGDDADGDGTSNLQEYQMQTSPTTAADCFQLQAGPPVPGGTNFMLQWDTPPDCLYSVYMVTNLSMSNQWRLVGVGVSEDDTVIYTNRSGASQQFYKVQVTP
ncbi:MAG: CARDB domain-containing protein, partial [bacterium]